MRRVSAMQLLLFSTNTRYEHSQKKGARKREEPTDTSVYAIDGKNVFYLLTFVHSPEKSEKRGQIILYPAVV